jgi:hypothetical protein
MLEMDLFGFYDLQGFIQEPTRFNRYIERFSNIKDYPNGGSAILFVDNKTNGMSELKMSSRFSYNCCAL